VESWLAQTRPADQIVVVDDSSTDRTHAILKKFGRKIKLVKTPKNTGNKSHAQEYGLRFVKGDIFISTDADTLMEKNFIEKIEKDFSDPSVIAVGGYVKSLRHNWLTACRAIDYALGQNIDKLAQDYMNFMFVIPGAAGAFRTDFFKKNIRFDHDTLTEDLDFTFKIHERNLKIKYNREAICYTQDPANFRSYVNQMRRWYAGGWQNFMKHAKADKFPAKLGMAVELSLIYGEGLVFSFLFFLVPLINAVMTLKFMTGYFFLVFLLICYAYAKEKRKDFFLVMPAYIGLKYVNAWIFIEQFFKEVVLKRKNLTWFKPDRVKIK
jgi:cellulose synthase/poly-beta-1,6-N-acetylglucosamine synthase-like glycosyltransferase